MAEWLTEQSRTAKERRRHDGDPEGEVRSTESRATGERRRDSRKRRNKENLEKWPSG